MFDLIVSHLSPPVNFGGCKVSREGVWPESGLFSSRGRQPCEVYSIADGQPASRRSSLARLIWLALLSGMVMTAWDLVMDPILSGVGFLAWEEGGAYFGVPIRNFVGWMVTTFAIYLLYRLWERRVGLRPLGPVISGLVWMVLLAHGGQLLRTFSRPVMGLIACSAMGLPLLAAAGRVSTNGGAKGAGREQAG